MSLTEIVVSGIVLLSVAGGLSLASSRGDVQAPTPKPLYVDCSLVQDARTISLLAEPRTSARVVATLKCGEELKVVLPSQDGWTKIAAANGSEGYLRSTLLSAAGPGERVPPALRVGGAVSAPRAIFAPDPEYSEEARRAGYQGTVVLWVVVGADGLPHDIRVQRTLGKGLDEKAIEAVRKWKFEPAKKDGVPVAVQINVETNFRLYHDKSETQLPRPPLPPMPNLPDSRGSQFPGVDREKYPLDVSVQASRTQYESGRNISEMAITILDGKERRGYTIACGSESGNCGHLIVGIYPARWKKGKLEIIWYRAGDLKMQKSEYTVVAENCETPFTCR
jgi:TonB family protein